MANLRGRFSSWRFPGGAFHTQKTGEEGRVALLAVFD
jgi:hypothetical protein